MTVSLILTQTGLNRSAVDLNGGSDLDLASVGVGDGNGLIYIPNANQTEMVNERYRCLIAERSTVGNLIGITVIIPADTPDAQNRPSHGFTVREIGIYAGDGALVAIASIDLGTLYPPGIGVARDIAVRLLLTVANASAVTIAVSPVAQIALGRLVRAGWITVDGVLNAPPETPALGATYVIGAAPTGAWTGFAGRIAQWIGVWSLTEAPLGHVVADNSKAESDPVRYLKHDTTTTWVSAAATEDAYGLTRLSTVAEALAGQVDDAAVTPEGLRAAKENLPLLFVARAAAATTVTADVWTKLSLGTEVVDTGNAFTPATGRFQPAKEGFYAMWGVCTFGSNNDNPTTGVRIYKNGVVVTSGLPSTILGSQFGCVKNGSCAVCSGISYFNGTTDYCELFGYKSSHTSVPDYIASNAYMAGYFLGVGA